MSHDVYQTLAEGKCEELAKKAWALNHLYDRMDGRGNSVVGGTVKEAIARDFIREYLDPGLTLKPGLVFDDQTNTMSPQLDGIIYSGAPLLQYTDVAVVRKQQVKAIVEVKALIQVPGRGWDHTYKKCSAYKPDGRPYILFGFELWGKLCDQEVLKHLKPFCDEFAVVIRREPAAAVKAGLPARNINFDGSVGRLIEWLHRLEP